MQLEKYDIAVIGLGPAGSIFCSLTAGRHRIAAIDKKSNAADSFMKPCGGLLAPDAQKALAALNMSLPLDIMVDPQIFSVRTIDLETGRSRNYQRFYLNLDRHKFDMWLKNRIPEKADVFAGSVCKKIEKKNGAYEITFSQGSGEKIIIADKVVGADGASSVVRRSLFPKKKMRKYMAVQQWFAFSEKAPVYSCLFDSENTDCYSWTLSKNNNFIFGGAYPIDNAVRRFENQKKKMKEIGIPLDNPINTEMCLVMRPAGAGQFSVANENAFLIGEAAGFVSPSSLEGISSAIESARILAKILNSAESAPAKAYLRASRKLRRKLTLKLLKCPFMYKKLLRNIVLWSGFDSINTEEENL